MSDAKSISHKAISAHRNNQSPKYVSCETENPHNYVTSAKASSQISSFNRSKALANMPASNMNLLVTKCNIVNNNTQLTENNIENLSQMNTDNFNANAHLCCQSTKLTKNIFMTEQRAKSLKKDEAKKLNVIARYHKEFDTILETKKNRVRQLHDRETKNRNHLQKMEQTHSQTQTLKMLRDNAKLTTDIRLHSDNIFNQQNNYYGRKKINSEANKIRTEHVDSNVIRSYKVKLIEELAGLRMKKYKEEKLTLRNLNIEKDQKKFSKKTKNLMGREVNVKFIENNYLESFLDKKSAEDRTKKHVKTFLRDKIVSLDSFKLENLYHNRSKLKNMTNFDLEVNSSGLIIDKSIGGQSTKHTMPASPFDTVTKLVKPTVRSRGNIKSLYGIHAYKSSVSVTEPVIRRTLSHNDLKLQSMLVKSDAIETEENGD